jgi:hypothetical protein
VAARRLSSRAVRLGLLGTLSLALAACAPSGTGETTYDSTYEPAPAAEEPAYVPPAEVPPADAVTAYCVSDETFAEADGSYELVDDTFCDDESYAGIYYWYYGGLLAGSRVHSGSTVMPRHGTVVTSGGREISRGGFGNRTSGGVSG